MKIKRGELVVVVGSTGAGKSSLLAGMLGESNRGAGSIGVGLASANEGVAFAGQSAWIQNATLRFFLQYSFFCSLVCSHYHSHSYTHTRVQGKYFVWNSIRGGTLPFSVTCLCAGHRHRRHGKWRPHRNRRKGNQSFWRAAATW